jgi:hypothetical protein
VAVRLACLMSQFILPLQQRLAVTQIDQLPG